MEPSLPLVQTQTSTSVPPATRHCVPTCASTPWAATAVNAGRVTSGRTMARRVPRETNTPTTPVSSANDATPGGGQAPGSPPVLPGERGQAGAFGRMAGGVWVGKDQDARWGPAGHSLPAVSVASWRACEEAPPSGAGVLTPGRTYLRACANLR